VPDITADKSCLLSTSTKNRVVMMWIITVLLSVANEHHTDQDELL